MGFKKYQVFISSTYEDLKEERAAVTSCLLDYGCIPVGMEQFPAMPVSQWDYIVKMIDESDYYLLIVAGRYGSVDPSSGLSYTEKEFQYALEHKIPIIAFIKQDIDKLADEKRETTEEGIKNIERFTKNVLNSNILCKFFSTTNDLKYKISVSLKKTIEDFPAIGWVRTDQIGNYQSKIIERLQEIILMMKNTKMEETLTKLNIEEKDELNDNISTEAMTLLREACGVEANGEIIASHDSEGITISAGKHVFCDAATAKLSAIWVGAVDELEQKGYIEKSKNSDEIYHVTNLGYKCDDRFGTAISSELRKKGFDNGDIAIINTVMKNENYNISQISNSVGLTGIMTVKKIDRLKNRGILEEVSTDNGVIWKVHEENIKP